MSEPTTELPSPPPPPALSTSPLALTDFPPAVQRNLDPKSPVPIRLMAAKGILVCPPRDFLSALFVLTFDPEPKVAEVARSSSIKLSEKIISGLRDEDLDPLVLRYYAHALRDNNQALELIALNPETPDDALAEVAAVASDQIIEIIAGNQQAILRDDRIVRAIVANPNTRVATRDSLLDFCVRSGLQLMDLPEYLEARRRILGEDPVAAAEITEAEKHTVEALEREFGSALTAEGVAMNETQRLTFTQRLMKMSVSQKIKLAGRGNKETRTFLLRDSNKLVALAEVGSPRITEGEVLSLANNRTLHDDVMRFIVRNRERTKNYQVKVNLVNNPKTPVANSLKLLQFLHPSELKKVAGNKNIAAIVMNQARGALMKTRK